MLAATNALVLQGVGRKFGSLVALDDISFTVKAGERRAVLGANGAGKTTLFNVITGDFPPTSGRISLFDEDVTNLAAHLKIRKGLRRTYQKSLLFGHLSVLDNLYLATRGVSAGRFSLRRPKQTAPSLLAAKALVEKVGLQAVAGTLVSELSHGQQRQLEIGMALVGEPKLILLDEPAAGLSPAERTELVRILSELPRSITFIIIEHDLDVALKVADNVTIMNNGTLFREGTPEQIQNDPEVQAIYLGKH